MKNGYDLPLSIKALMYFIKNPYDEIYLREYARKLNISPNSAQRFLAKFLKYDFIKDFRRGNLRYFKADMDSRVFKQTKIIYSLFSIQESGFVGYFEEAGVSHLVLFGSVAKGEDDEKSDIDIVVIGGGEGMERSLRNFEKKLDREINFHHFTWPKWKETRTKNKAFYQDVISQGIALIGEMPV